MKTVEIIVGGILIGIILGLFISFVLQAIKTWILRRNALGEIEEYKDKFYVELPDGNKIPFADYIRGKQAEQTRLKNTEVKGGLFKKKNAEDKFKKEARGRVSSYGEDGEQTTNAGNSHQSNNSSISSSANTTTGSNNSRSSKLSKHTFKEEATDWDFH